MRRAGPSHGTIGDMTFRAALAPGRSGPLAAEVAALAGLTVLDLVLAVLAGAPHGPAAQLAASVVPGVGTVVAVLAVLRRRFRDRVGLLTWSAVGLSLVATATGLAVRRPAWEVDAAETLALALLVGASARVLAPRAATWVVAAGGLAMAGGPVLRHDWGSPGALFAVVAALAWGAGLAVGLILRDADARRAVALAEVRVGERLRLARELHDLVAHHVTGMVVLAQAAGVVSARPDGAFAEIERAGAEALNAMRRLVGMLRTDGDTVFDPPGGLVDAVDRAVPDDGSVALTMPDDLGTVEVTPEAAATVHRVLLEALTNARRHAPGATEVAVSLAVEAGWLVVSVVNDGAAARGSGAGRGYGLVGMVERVEAVGGSVRAEAERPGRWRVTARLPLSSGPSGPDGAGGATGVEVSA